MPGRNDKKALIRLSRVDQLQRTAFCTMYASTANIAVAAEAAKVSYAKALTWVKDAKSPAPENSDFALQFAAAEKHAADLVEDEIDRRGRRGYEEPVIASGELVWQAFDKKTGEPLPTVRDSSGAIVVTTQDGVVLNPPDYVIRPLTIRRYSDRLLLARARALRPEKYGADVMAEPEDTNRRAQTLRDLVASARPAKAS